MKFLLSVAAVVAVAAAPPAFKIVNVVSGGTGCPQGSIEVNWTDERVLPICKSPYEFPFLKPSLSSSFCTASLLKTQMRTRFVG